MGWRKILEAEHRLMLEVCAAAENEWRAGQFDRLQEKARGLRPDDRDAAVARESRASSQIRESEGRCRAITDGR